MAANQVVLYFDKQEDALLHPGCQFSHVSGRAGPPQRRSGQGGGGDLQSQSNHG